MRKFNLATGVGAVLLAAMLSAPLQAQRGMPQSGHVQGGAFPHHGHRVLVFVGAPIFWAWYYAPDAGYDAQIDPEYFLPMNDSHAPIPAPTIMYFCAEANAFYPYVSECLDGWQMVILAPPD
jgi:hypothetical protein